MSPGQGAGILLVEDDHRIGSSLLRALGGSGLEARWVSDGRGALAAVSDVRPDLVLLDLGLPDADGLDICRRIHDTDPTIDVIMLTARDDELDVVVGLDAGAVDYITKPFTLAELLARVRAQLRRGEATGSAGAGETRCGPITVGDLTIDRAARMVTLHGEELVLRAKEFDLLLRLMVDGGLVVTRETLMAEVWDEHWFGSTKTLDFHVAALRRKIDDDGRPSRITTLRGVGFRLETP